MAPWNPIYKGLKAHQIIVEISTGIYIYIYIQNHSWLELHTLVNALVLRLVLLHDARSKSTQSFAGSDAQKKATGCHSHNLRLPFQGDATHRHGNLTETRFILINRRCVKCVRLPETMHTGTQASELSGSACPCSLPQTVYRMFSSSSESKMASAKYIAPSSSTWWASGTNYYWSNKPNSQAAKQFVELYHSPKM